MIRALELAIASGETWSERLRREGTWGGEAERYASLKIGLDTDRERLRSLLAPRPSLLGTSTDVAIYGGGSRDQSGRPGR